MFLLCLSSPVPELKLLVPFTHCVAFPFLQILQFGNKMNCTLFFSSLTNCLLNFVAVWEVSLLDLRVLGFRVVALWPW